MQVTLKKDRPDFRMCEHSTVRCQTTNCLKLNLCQQIECNGHRPTDYGMAVAERYNRYIGWPERGVIDEVKPEKPTNDTPETGKHPEKRYCEASPQFCQNTNCLKTNVCGSFFHDPKYAGISARGIAKADKENKKLGWPPAGTPV